MFNIQTGHILDHFSLFQIVSVFRCLSKRDIKMSIIISYLNVTKYFVIKFNIAYFLLKLKCITVKYNQLVHWYYNLITAHFEYRMFK